jgi:hypothetical protein
MASLRETFTVGWDDGEPIEVTTTVQDLIDAVEAVAARGYNGNRIALETTLIHAALIRTGVDPPPYDAWVLVLDSYEKRPAPGGGPVDEGPTEPDPSPSGP